jgi:hypothetical protein
LNRERYQFKGAIVEDIAAAAKKAAKAVDFGFALSSYFLAGAATDAQIIGAKSGESKTTCGIWRRLKPMRLHCQSGKKFKASPTLHFDGKPT